MFDVFYTGKKPNLFAHEQAANSLEHAQSMCRTRMFWWVNYLSDYSDFDFLWEPVPWEAHQRHAWASQWQKDCGTYLVPKVDYKDTNYHTQQIPRRAGVPVYEIDHMDGAAGQIPNTVRSIRYFDNYKDTLTRLAKSVQGQHEFIWVCSSICDYTDFDFGWHPDPWQKKLLHVFDSDRERFGDTFYMHVDSFAEKAPTVELLEWYDCNFVGISVPRRPMPVIQHNGDSHVEAVKQSDFAGPLATFTVVDYMRPNMATVPLWREKTKTIVPLNPGASCVVVPKTAIPYIRKQLYDYPYIDKTKMMFRDEPLDIVFISNGEPNAESNLKLLSRCRKLGPNKIHRVKNVNGRVAAYHAAAQASTTPWFFAIFGKLRINIDFDFSWQPDRLQQPKHYIFHAKNPVNGLEYGHQGLIVYNKNLVLANPGSGLDFTLDDPHEVVPVISGLAHYVDSPWTAWRTAFRETLKLRASLPDVENEYRLNRWLTPAVTEIAHAAWSHKGAEDAMEYYDSVDGDFAALKKSYEWAWLASYAFIRRGISPN
jgi:hypothetical protein